MKTSKWADDDYVAMFLMGILSTLVGALVSLLLCLFFGFLTMWMPLNMMRAIAMFAGLTLWVWIGTKVGSIGNFQVSGQKGSATGWIGGYGISMLMSFSLLHWIVG